MLGDHGWIIHRVWGPDWFQRPVEQLERIVAAVEAARTELGKREQTGRLTGRAVFIEVVTVDRADTREVGLQGTPESCAVGTPYREATSTIPVGVEMHDVSASRIAELVEQVVAVKGPTHVDEVVVRLRTAWGLQHAGVRIQAAVERACAVCEQRGRLVRDGGFLSVPGQAVVVHYRGAAASASLRRLEMLPSAETEAAILKVLVTGLGASSDEIAVAAPRLFGFKAVSAQLRQLVSLSNGRSA